MLKDLSELETELDRAYELVRSAREQLESLRVQSAQKRAGEPAAIAVKAIAAERVRITASKREAEELVRRIKIALREVQKRTE